jgi:rod shape-determining protein MreC
MAHVPPPLFVRGPTPLVRLCFYGMLGIFLLMVDARFRFIEPLRQALLWITYPAQKIASAPVELFGEASDFFVSQATLKNDNRTLRQEKLLDAESLLRMQALSAENQRLRSLLGARARFKGTPVFAEVTYLGRDPFSRKVIIDKGSQSGVALGEPVIDASGVIGQVTHVHPLFAEVTLVIDKNQAIPVEVLRNGLRGVAFGAGDGSGMELRFMPANAEILPGDELVTSGIDNVYPYGLPVAKVTRIDKEASYAFARILCAPAGGPAQSKEVLVLGAPAQAQNPYPESAAPAPGPAKPRARRERRP